jgi:hypothetical protein
MREAADRPLRVNRRQEAFGRLAVESQIRNTIVAH